MLLPIEVLYFNIIEWLQIIRQPLRAPNMEISVSASAPTPCVCVCVCVHMRGVCMCVYDVLLEIEPNALCMVLT